ncbi:nudix hydrolase [Escherichia coli]|nr:nudix hydrolase [Escherichia coli]SQT08460.1 nudix hydrolase [Escherichia coli]SRZ43880.1 nudix hydrolase [Escherichia coli]
MLRNARVYRAISYFRNQYQKRYTADLDLLVSQLMAIVQADPNQLAQFRRVNCRYCWGENHLYRKRALIAMQKHSPAHKDVNIRAIADSATLAVLEDAIFSAARQSIEKEMMSTQGQLHKRIRNDEAGRRITEYQGDPNVWLSAFKIPGRRLAKINTQGSLNNG